ncbi:hypothetical protein SAMD00019534_101990, partial [Acytostelium subglobosum LB1]|uniref:hypothetical protein n=1 Tax=Acytostelium subglobosum LB1 TaxID=1410327 RepID=UPI000644B983
STQKMKLIGTVLFLLVVLTSAHSIYGDIWTSCGSSSDHFAIDTVLIVPDPPVKGQVVNITASGTLNEQITDGTVHITLKYGFITILNQNEPLCNADNPLPCPIAAGSYTRSFATMIPSTVPSGKYSANVVINDQNGQEVACINVALQL